MPALAPVWARAGRAPAATARAVASATAREAGLARRTLLGVRQTFMCGKVRSPSPGTQAMDGPGRGQHKVVGSRPPKTAATNPANTAGRGRGALGALPIRRWRN